MNYMIQINASWFEAPLGGNDTEIECKARVQFKIFIGLMHLNWDDQVVPYIVQSTHIP